MKIYILGRVFDTNETPVVLRLDSEEKKHIAMMDENASHYLNGPSHLTEDDMHAFIDIAKKRFNGLPPKSPVSIELTY